MTADTNEHVDTARQNIIHQFVTIEPKKRYRKQVTRDFQVDYPVSFVNIDEIKRRTLLDVGAGRSYISPSLANQLKKNPSL